MAGTASPSDPASGRTPLAVLFGFVAGGVGLALNYAPVEIFPAVHVLLGPLATLLVAVLLGPIAGGVAAMVAASRTVVLWGHPYAWAIYVLEGVAVGYGARRLRPVGADVTFWVLGGPAIALSYHYGLGTPWTECAISAVKQAINSAVLALAIEVGLLVPSFRRLMHQWLPKPLREVTLGGVFGSALALGVTVPLLILGMIEGRVRYQAEREDLEQENLLSARLASEEADNALTLTMGSARVLAGELATAVVQNGHLPGASEIQVAAELRRQTFPNLEQIAVVDAAGTVLAAAPPLPYPARALALEAGDLERIRSAGTLILTETSAHPPELPGRQMRVAAPILAGDRFEGYVILELNGVRLAEMIRRRLAPGQRALLVDSRGQVVLDSGEVDAPERPPDPALIAQVVDTERESGSYVADPGGGALRRARMTYAFATARLEQADWRAVVESPTERLSNDTARSFRGLLTSLIILLTVMVAGAFALGRLVVSPLRRVAEAAAALASGRRESRVGAAIEGEPVELVRLGGAFDRMAADIAAQLEAIERASREKDAFLSIASHELKTPLTVLKTRIELLLRAPARLDPAQLEQLNRQVDRLTRLINQMLDVSRIGVGTLALEPSWVDLAEIAQRVAEGVVQASPRHGLKLRLEPTWGCWDEVRIEQVLHNLLANAVKYSPGGGQIEVHVRCNLEGEAELIVADRGVGIGDGGDELFDRFARGHQPAVAHVAGLGVGLYVAREIVARHGGRITLRARDGGGTVAEVALPGAQPRPPVQPGATLS